MTKECKLCGRAFEPNTGSQKYCSTECRRIADAPRNRERSRKDYYKHREERLEKSKVYYHAHKDTILKKCQTKQKPKKVYQREQNFFKRMDNCCLRHGGIDNCPFDDCVCK